MKQVVEITGSGDQRFHKSVCVVDNLQTYIYPLTLHQFLNPMSHVKFYVPPFRRPIIFSLIPAGPQAFLH